MTTNIENQAARTIAGSMEVGRVKRKSEFQAGYAAALKAAIEIAHEAMLSAERAADNAKTSEVIRQMNNRADVAEQIKTQIAELQPTAEA